MNPDILVIGGGLHGLSCALQAARRGASVLVLERHFLGRHASGSTAAGVRTLGRDPAELPLSLEAAETWHKMAELVGDDCGFKACGQLQVAEDDAAMASIAARVTRLEKQGMHHEKLIGPDQLRELVPAISPHCAGAAWAPGDGSADPHRAIRAFRDAAKRAGVNIIEQCQVLSLGRNGQSWQIHTTTGDFSAAVVINAAGAWADKIAKMAGEPVRHAIRTSMMVVTERTGDVVRPVISSFGRKLSFKQTAEGTLLIGGGAQGRLAADKQSASVDVQALSVAVQAAVRLFPSMVGTRMVRAWAGMEAMTEDHLPVIGFSDQAEGLIHAFGFSGHGFQLVPSVGRVVADLAIEGKSNQQLDAFNVNRVSEKGVALC
ncbi:FAD-binding oxidoreductase [Thalassospira sp. MCCC 1A01428]|uniref:NAD(P)/FAD-dependent oxidoreductase n=1 Tax=Thalassospira sp. MCCC 1A01428 TaxID=1470575 RepID=UPI000A1E6E66|nr:FAD-dependent oxidoreductase [Thalassospira sp. MCCC 1A01428]OSQ39179.1 FAD-dependent oxidoreductase [Thalassospira sp. MCCC 1A01428]